MMKSDSQRVGQLFAVLLPLLLTTLPAYSQTAYEDTWVQEERYLRPAKEISRQVERQLKMDAARLSLRSDADDLRRADIHISASQTQQFYDLLQKVYLHNRSMIDCYHIKTANRPSTDYIRLVYQKGVAWAKPLQSGISSTDQRLINAILERYDLIIEKVESLNTRQDALTLRAVNPINAEALASNFYGIEGIEAVELEERTPARSDIVAKRSRNAWELQYILRYDHAGRLQEHTWVYRVKDSGGVELLEETSALLPNWVGCE